MILCYDYNLFKMDEDTVLANDQAAIQDGFDTMLSQLSFNDHSEGEEEK